MRQQHELPFYRRWFSRNTPKKTLFMRALARMSDVDIAKTTQDALGYALPQFEQKSRAPLSSSTSASKSCQPLSIHTSVEDSELEIKGMGVAVPSDEAEKDQTLTQFSNQTDSSNSMARQIFHIPTSGDCRQLAKFHSAGERSKDVFELQEVVIHGPSDAESSHHLSARADGSTDRSSVISPAIASAVTPTKTAVPIAAHQRGAMAQTLAAAFRRPTPAAGVAADSGWVVSDWPQADSAADVVPQSAHLSVFAFGAATGSPDVPQPPPTSRSRSRTRQTNHSNSITSSASDNPLATADGSIQAGQRMSRRSREHSTLRPSDRAGQGQNCAAELQQCSPAARPQAKIRSSLTPGASATVLQAPVVGGVVATLPPHQGRQSDAVMALSSKKPPSKRSSKRMEKCATNWEQKVHAMRDEFGDRFEEC